MGRLGGESFVAGREERAELWGSQILFASETRVNKAGKKAMDGAMSSFPFKNAHAEEAKKML